MTKSSSLHTAQVQTRCRRQTPQPFRPAASRLMSGLRRWSAAFWLNFMFWWTDHFPPAVLRTRPFFLWWAWNYSRMLRQGTTANAQRILGPDAPPQARDNLARSVLSQFYLNIYDLGCALRAAPEELQSRIETTHGVEHYDKARASGRGAIVVTAHFGPFEIGAAALSNHEKRAHVVFQRDEFPRFEALRTRLRTRLGLTEVPVDEGWNIWFQLRDALLRDEIVMIQGDRVLPGQRGAPVPFMGGHVLLPAGPVKLALATGAPLVPVFSTRTASGRVQVTIEEPINVGREQGAVDGNHPALRTFAAHLEKWVRMHPEQWIMVHPVWCEDAEGA